MSLGKIKRYHIEHRDSSFTIEILLYISLGLDNYCIFILIKNGVRHIQYYQYTLYDKYLFS